MEKNFDDSFWSDPVVRTLDADAKYLFKYFMGNEHDHYSGIYRIPSYVICGETGLTNERLDKALAQLVEKGRVVLDDERELVWIVNMAKHRTKNLRPDLVLKGIVKHFAGLHNSPLINDFQKMYPHLCNGIDKACLSLGQPIV